MLRECAKIRLYAPAVNEMELWEIAEAMGVAEKQTPRFIDGRPLRSGRDLVAERVAAERGDAPVPEPDEPGPAMLALAQQLMVPREVDESGGRAPG